MRRPVATGLLAASAATLLCLPLVLPRATLSQDDPAARAVMYLQQQQSATTGGLSAPGSGYGTSALYAIDAATAGFDPGAMRNGGGPSVIRYLEQHAAAACAAAGACADVIQAAVAAGKDARTFGGVNLVARLQATYHPGTGAFGDGSAFTESLAIQALVAAGTPPPAGAPALLLRAQDSDGGWNYLDARNDAAGSDTNSTAMALMALDAAGNHGRDASALAWLRIQQDGDGGFPYQAGSGTDPDSTALVVQAITATGGDPRGAGWSGGGVSPYARLVAEQSADGGYAFPGNGGPDAFTTSEVPPALALQPFPVHGVFHLTFTPHAEAAATLLTLRFLASRLAASGAFAGAAANSDSSELFVIGTAAAGYDPSTVRALGGTGVVAHLAAGAPTLCGAADTAASCGRLIQAAAAAGSNPRAFGGVDLVSRLQSQYDARSGRLADGEAFTQSIAIQGLVAAHAAVPSGAIAFLTRAQDSDGGWDYRDIHDDRNPKHYDTSDTNSTAMVLMALDAAGEHSRDASALAWLHTQQDGDGGFPYAHGAGTDPDSTALVVQAITATGDDVTTGEWARNGWTPLARLVAEQGADGGYTFPGNPSADAFTTAQVPLGLERAAFPVPFASRRFYVPGTSLGQVPPAPPPPPPSPRPSAGVVRAAAPPTPTVRATTSSAAPVHAAAGRPAAEATSTSAPSISPTAQIPPISSAPVPPGVSRVPRLGFPLPLLYGLVGLAAVLAGAASAAVLRRR